MSKEGYGAKVQRRHDKPATACDRLLACEHIYGTTQKRLKATREALNPFELARQIETALRAILYRALRSSRTTGSLALPGTMRLFFQF